MSNLNPLVLLLLGILLGMYVVPMIRERAGI